MVALLMNRRILLRDHDYPPAPPPAPQSRGGGRGGYRGEVMLNVDRAAGERGELCFSS